MPYGANTGQGSETGTVAMVTVSGGRVRHTIFFEGAPVEEDRNATESTWPDRELPPPVMQFDTCADTTDLAEPVLLSFR
jgi:hypothetical protein